MDVIQRGMMFQQLAEGWICKEKKKHINQMRKSWEGWCVEKFLPYPVDSLVSDRGSDEQCATKGIRKDVPTLKTVQTGLCVDLRGPPGGSPQWITGVRIRKATTSHRTVVST